MLFAIVALVLAPSAVLAYGTNTGPPVLEDVNVELVQSLDLTDAEQIPEILTDVIPVKLEKARVNLTTAADNVVGWVANTYGNEVNLAANGCPTCHNTLVPAVLWETTTASPEPVLVNNSADVDHDIGQLTEAEITEVLDLVGEQPFQVALNCPRPPALMAESIKEAVVTGACVCCYKAGKVVCDC